MVVGTTLVVLERRAILPRGDFEASRWLLAALAVGNLFVVAGICANHIGFPYLLESMEATVLQHFRRALAFQPLYPAPTPDFVALAYNPLYYYLSAPAGWLFGDGLATLRGVSIAATAGSAALVFGAVRHHTRDPWWGLVGLGLFAAAYHAMDNYLDTAHADASLLFCALLGTSLLDRSRSRRGELAGVALLVAAFWIKQHGALFAVGGLAFATWRHGFARSAPHWALALLLGPALYAFAGPLLFGSHFHFFTWQVPSGWTEFESGNFVLFAKLLLRNYALLGAAATGLFAAAWREEIPGRVHTPDAPHVDAWTFLLPFAALSGVLGALDPGSSYNVYIPVGTWLIVVGTLGLHACDRLAWGRRFAVAPVALVVSFALLLYDPRPALVSPGADTAYADLLFELESLGGTVYAPGVGQLPRGATLHPAAHIVALEDLVRGPRPALPDSSKIRELLADAVEPEGEAWLLMTGPLDSRSPAVGFLRAYYTQHRDYRARFQALRGVDHRWAARYPRFLYRFSNSGS